MKKLVAVLACAALLAAAFGLFVFVQGGGYGRLLTGQPVGSFDTLLSTAPEHYRLRAIAGIVLVLFFVMDIHTLVARPEDAAAHAPQPGDRPLDYAVVRLRRFLLIPLVLGYGVLALRLLPPASVTELATGPPLIGLSAVFLLTRRPLNWTPGQVVGLFLAMVTSAAENYRR